MRELSDGLQRAWPSGCRSSIEFIRARPRPQPRLPGRRVATSCARRSPRCAPSTSCWPRRQGCRRGDAQRVPRAEPPADRAPGLAGDQPPGAVQARIRAWSLLDLRPDDLRAVVENAVHQAEPNAERKGVKLTMELPDGPDPPAPRPAAHRPGARQPHRQRHQVHAGGGSVDVDLREDGRGRGAAWWSTPASASTPTSCRASSSASTAAPRSRRAARPARDLVFRSSVHRGDAQRPGGDPEHAGRGTEVTVDVATGTCRFLHLPRPPPEPGRGRLSATNRADAPRGIADRHRHTRPETHLSDDRPDSTHACVRPTAPRQRGRDVRPPTRPQPTDRNRWTAEPARLWHAAARRPTGSSRCPLMHRRQRQRDRRPVRTSWLRRDRRVSLSRRRWRPAARTSRSRRRLPRPGVRHPSPVDRADHPSARQLRRRSHRRELGDHRRRRAVSPAVVTITTRGGEAPTRSGPDGCRLRDHLRLAPAGSSPTATWSAARPGRASSCRTAANSRARSTASTP